MTSKRIAARLAVTTLALGLLGGPVACSSQASDPGPVFNGTYIPTSSSSSSTPSKFASVVLDVDGTYRFTRAACTGASCISYGTFVFNGSDDLALTDETTAVTMHLAVGDIAADAPKAGPATTQSVHPLSGLVSSSSGGSLVNASSGGPLVTALSSATPIAKASLDGVAMKRAPQLAAPRVFTNLSVAKPNKTDVYAKDWKVAFNEADQWPGTIAVTNVIQLWEDAIGVIMSNPNTLIDTVKTNNLQISVETEGLNNYYCRQPNYPTAGTPEKQAEFIGSKTAAEVIADFKPIFDAGGEVTYAALDTDGITNVMDKSDGDTCHFTLTQAVNSQIIFMKAVHKVYPNIQFGLIPNFPNYNYDGTLCYIGTQTDCDFSFPGQDYKDVLDTQISMIHSQGEAIYFVHVDNPYNYLFNDKTLGNTVMKTRILPLRDQVVTAGLNFGMIANTELAGNVHGAAGNSDFEDQTIADARYMAKNGLGSEDDFIVESWFDYPDMNMPDTTVGTFTSAANGAISTFLQASGR